MNLQTRCDHFNCFLFLMGSKKIKRIIVQFNNGVYSFVFLIYLSCHTFWIFYQNYFAFANFRQQIQMAISMQGSHNLLVDFSCIEVHSAQDMQITSKRRMQIKDIWLVRAQRFRNHVNHFDNEWASHKIKEVESIQSAQTKIHQIVTYKKQLNCLHFNDALNIQEKQQDSKGQHTYIMLSVTSK